jgi:hypothetical protein
MDATHLFLTRKIEKPGGFVSLFPRKAQVHLIDDFFLKGKTVGESPTAIFINLSKVLQNYITTSI